MPDARVVLISGASAGIGHACAERLDRSGWVVVGASRRAGAPVAWATLSMDVDDDRSVDDGVRSVLESHGRLDAVVACAGWGLAGPVERTPIADARRQLETNFWGAVRLVGAALPTMRARRAGHVVLVSSIGGAIGIPFQAFYSASKFALEGYGEALAYEVEPFGVQVTMVQPGNVRTDFTTSRLVVGAGLGGGDPGTPDPYGAAARKAVALMERDEAAGVAPDRVAAVVERVLSAGRPPRRVSVGKPGERVGLVAKRLLPHRAFERAARGSLGV